MGKLGSVILSYFGDILNILCKYVITCKAFCEWFLLFFSLKISIKLPITAEETVKNIQHIVHENNFISQFFSVMLLYCLIVPT